MNRRFDFGPRSRRHHGIFLPAHIPQPPSTPGPHEFHRCRFAATPNRVNDITIPREKLVIRQAVLHKPCLGREGRGPVEYHKACVERLYSDRGRVRPAAWPPMPHSPHQRKHRSTENAAAGPLWNPPDQPEDERGLPPAAAKSPGSALVCSKRIICPASEIVPEPARAVLLTAASADQGGRAPGAWSGLSRHGQVDELRGHQVRLATGLSKLPPAPELHLRRPIYREALRVVPAINSAKVITETLLRWKAGNYSGPQ